MNAQLHKSAVLFAAVILLDASCASQSRKETAAIQKPGSGSIPSQGGKPAKAEGARPGTFNPATGAWTDTGPPCTDTTRNFRMIMSDTATALLWIPVGVAYAAGSGAGSYGGGYGGGCKGR